MVDNAEAQDSIDNGCQSDQLLPLSDTLSVVVKADRTNPPIMDFFVDHDVPCQQDGFYRQVPGTQDRISVEMNDYCDRPGEGFTE